jgi:hypothetical protein
MSGGAMITAGHLLMLALMLWRRREYGHGGHSPSQAEPATGEPVVNATEKALA